MQPEPPKRGIPMRTAWNAIPLAIGCGLLALLLSAGRAGADGLDGQQRTAARGGEADASEAGSSPDPVTDDPETLKSLYCLYAQSRRDQGQTERGAWIVSENGVRRCIPWPFSFQKQRAQPEGPPPANAFEAVHTHPTHPEFSLQDYRFAKAYGRPLYLIHRRGIWKYDPHTDLVTKKKDSRWLQPFRKLGERLCGCEVLFGGAEDLLVDAGKRGPSPPGRPPLASVPGAVPETPSLMGRRR
jgi:hypothetical protein